MAETYSTLGREVATGRLFSTQHSHVLLRSHPRVAPSRPVPAGVAAAAPAKAVAPVARSLPSEAPPPAPIHRTFLLTSLGLPAASGLVPEGASGRVQLLESGGTWQVEGELAGLLPPRDPALQPVLWLIHDLPVPEDLHPADLAMLPKGRQGTGNAAGSLFTLDGNPTTYGPVQNSLSIAISPGAFAAEGGQWRLHGAIDPETNRCFHPLVALGPVALRDMNASIPSGSAARILTDLFMRPATVHPELHPQAHFAQRLAAVVQEAAGGPALYLEPTRFHRAAVTLEGPVRATPRLMPTRETCFLLGSNA